MPAKAKYLSTSGERALKVSAAILGGYILTMAIQLAVGSIIEDKAVMVITSAYSSFFLWVFFMIVAFLFDKAWKPWLYYLLGTGVCAIIIYLNL